MARKASKISNNLDALRLVGRLLYGEYWQKQMSITLKVSPRTMSRWEQKEFPVPDILPSDGSGLHERLLELLEKRREEIDEAVNDIGELVPQIGRPGAKPLSL